MPTNLCRMGVGAGLWLLGRSFKLGAKTGQTFDPYGLRGDDFVSGIGVGRKRRLVFVIFSRMIARLQLT
jgi:hypothetical protein